MPQNHTDGKMIKRLYKGAAYREFIKSVRIEDGVTSIGYLTFANCTGLTSITIPDSVTIIGYSAFDGCTGLTKLVYCGTGEEWDAIFKGSDWNKDVPATVQFHDFENYVCTACGATHEHEWDDGVITTPATHLSEGVKTFACPCGERKTEINIHPLCGWIFIADEGGRAMHAPTR
ncbi:MAG: leucine-rich repeat domain-containing protein [Clostridia bacterium]|nr:leucine-rich repeat domain-containing protein [Clostridia bacterium]